MRPTTLPTLTSKDAMQPAARNKPTVAQFVAKLISDSGKTEAQIAREMGYEGREGMVRMIVEGRSKLPLDKVNPFAVAVGVDPLLMLEIVLSEYSPSTWNAIQPIVGKVALTENEHGILDELRRLSDYSVPKMSTAGQRDALKAFAASLRVAKYDSVASWERR